MSIILAIFYLLYFWLARRRLDWALGLIIFALPFYEIRFSFLGVPWTILSGLIWTAILAWSTNLAERKWAGKISACPLALTWQFWRRIIFGREIILFLGFGATALLAAGIQPAALGAGKAYFLEPLIFFFLLNWSERFSPGASEQNGPGRRIFFWALVFSALAVSGLAVAQKLFNAAWVPEFWPRVTGPYPYPNAIGLYLGPLVLILFGRLPALLPFRTRVATRARNPLDIAGIKGFLADAQNNAKWIIVAITIVLSLMAIFFARSEGAIIGMLAGLLVIGLLTSKKWRWITLAAVALVGFGLLSYGPARNYALEKITLRDLSGEIRKQQWRETWEMLTASPANFALGAGLGGYQSAVAPFHQAGIFFNKDQDPDFRRKIVIFDDRYKAEHWQPVEVYLYPHNIFLNFWTELGLAGLLLFIWIMVKSIKVLIADIRYPMSDKISTFKLQITNLASGQDKYLKLGLLGALVVIIVHGLVDVPYFKNDLSLLFWLIIFLIGSAQARAAGKSK